MNLSRVFRRNQAMMLLEAVVAVADRTKNMARGVSFLRRKYLGGDTALPD